MMEEVQALCIAWHLYFPFWVLSWNSRHLFEKMVLHLQYLVPQSPPVIRWWHFDLNHASIWGDKNSWSLISSHWAEQGCDSLTAPMGNQPRGQPHICSRGTVSDLPFPEVRGQLCLHRDQDCNGNCHYYFLFPAGPWAQWFSCSHVSGTVYEERKHTLSEVQGLGPMFGCGVFFVVFSGNGNEISCLTTLKKSLPYSYYLFLCKKMTDLV